MLVILTLWSGTMRERRIRKVVSSCLLRSQKPEAVGSNPALHDPRNTNFSAIDGGLSLEEE